MYSLNKTNKKFYHYAEEDIQVKSENRSLVD